MRKSEQTGKDRERRREREREREKEVYETETSRPLSMLLDVRSKRLAVTTIQLMDGASPVSETWLIVTWQSPPGPNGWGVVSGLPTPSSLPVERCTGACAFLIPCWFLVKRDNASIVTILTPKTLSEVNWIYPMPALNFHYKSSPMVYSILPPSPVLDLVDPDGRGDQADRCKCRPLLEETAPRCDARDVQL